MVASFDQLAVLSMCYHRRISTLYTDVAHVSSTGAKQPTHTTRTRGTRCNTLFTPCAVPCAAPRVRVHLLHQSKRVVDCWQVQPSALAYPR